MPGLSIVIPAYNEQANVVSAVEKISAVAQTLDLDYEIILVNDGSRDQTGDLARTELMPRIPNFRLVEHFPNRGYGGALKAGFDAATQELIVFIPADNQFDFGEVRLLEGAVRRVGASLEREEAVNAAVPAPILVELEADLAERAIRRLEGRDRVGPSEPVGDHVGRVRQGGTASDGGLEVAHEALVGIEDGTHARRVDQRQRRERVLRIGIDRRNILRLL